MDYTLNKPNQDITVSGYNTVNGVNGDTIYALAPSNIIANGSGLTFIGEGGYDNHVFFNGDHETVIVKAGFDNITDAYFNKGSNDKFVVEDNGFGLAQGMGPHAVLDFGKGSGGDIFDVTNAKINLTGISEKVIKATLSAAPVSVNTYPGAETSYSYDFGNTGGGGGITLTMTANVIATSTFHSA